MQQHDLLELISRKVSRHSTMSSATSSAPSDDGAAGPRQFDAIEGRFQERIFLRVSSLDKVSSHLGIRAEGRGGAFDGHRSQVPEGHTDEGVVESRVDEGGGQKDSQRSQPHREIK